MKNAREMREAAKIPVVEARG